MASYVVRLDNPDIKDLLQQWVDWECETKSVEDEPGGIAPAIGTKYDRPTFFYRRDIEVEWGNWERSRWLRYCDNADGITLRLYDEPHFSHYAQKDAQGQYYIENPNPGSDEHFEMVIVRGYSMGTLPSTEAEPGLKVCHFLHDRLHVNPFAGGNAQFRQDATTLLRDITRNSLKLRIRAASNWMIWPVGKSPFNFAVQTSYENVAAADYPKRLAYFQHPERNNAAPPARYTEEDMV